MTRNINPREIQLQLKLLRRQTAGPGHGHGVVVGGTVGPCRRLVCDAVVAAAHFLQGVGGAAAGLNHARDGGFVDGVGGEAVEGVWREVGEGGGAVVGGAEVFCGHGWVGWLIGVGVGILVWLVVGLL